MLTRRILNNPKIKVYKISRVEMKLFLRVFLQDDYDFTTLTESIKRLKIDIISNSHSPIRYHSEISDVSPKRYGQNFRQFEGHCSQEPSGRQRGPDGCTNIKLNINLASPYKLDVVESGRPMVDENLRTSNRPAKVESPEYHYCSSNVKESTVIIISGKKICGANEGTQNEPFESTQKSLARKTGGGIVETGEFSHEKFMRSNFSDRRMNNSNIKRDQLDSDNRGLGSSGVLKNFELGATGKTIIDGVDLPREVLGNKNDLTR